MNNLHGQKGVTLVELMIAAALVSMVVYIAMIVYRSQREASHRQNTVVELQLANKRISSQMTGYISRAGYRIPSAVAIVTAEKDSLGIRFLADDSLICEKADTVSMEFFLSPDAELMRKLTCRPASGSDRIQENPMAKGVDSLEFRYLTASGNVTGAAANVRSVEVSLRSFRRGKFQGDSLMTRSTNFKVAPRNLSLAGN